MDADLGSRILEACSRLEDVPVVSFSGGEPFVEPDLLRALVEKASRLGVDCEVVSSAAWAVDEERARSALAELSALGLKTFCLSYDQFHEPFVPAARVCAAITAALEQDLGVVINFAAAPGSSETAERWLRSRLRLPETVWARCRVNSFRAARVGRGLAELPFPDAYSEESLGGCSNCGEAVAISPRGLLYACCGGALGVEAEDSLFVLDDLAGQSVPEIAAALRHVSGDTLVQLLAQAGPHGLLQILGQERRQTRGRHGFSGFCDVCIQLASEPGIRSVIRDRLDRTD